MHVLSLTLILLAHPSKELLVRVLEVEKGIVSYV